MSSASWVLAGMGLALCLGGLTLGHVFKAGFELSGIGKLRKGLGITAVVVGTLAMLRAFGLMGPSDLTHGDQAAWLDDFDAAWAQARKTQRPMVIDFSAEWCKACKELEHKTFPAPPVAERLAEWVTVRIDLTHDQPELEALQRRFKVAGLPTVAFVDSGGNWAESLTLTGFESAEAFIDRLDRVEKGMSGAGETGLAARINEGLAESSIWVYVLIFIAGVLASLSPCVYPLIPITISLFGGGDAKGGLRGFLLAVVYVAGIAVTYSALGLVAASTGALFGSALQSPWVVGSIAGVFVLMGLSMVGAFEIRIPAGISERLNMVGGAKSGRFIGAFLMGTVAGVVAAPCVGPPLVVVLTFVATHGDLLHGMGLLIIYSLGMGVLFIFLGTFTQLVTRMPKSGGWMEVVKGSLGIVLLVVGMVYLQDAIPVIP